MLTKTFFRYVSQSTAGMLGLSCYILADTFFIARGIGETGLTALNLAIPVFSLITGAGLMAGIGGATLYTLRREKRIFTDALLFTLAVSVLFFLCGVFLSEEAAYLLGADAVTLADTAVYLRTILLFSPFFLLNNLLSAFVRSDDAPRLAMTAQLAGSFSNILLDYLFIYPLGWGMAGAAFATCLAPIISLGILSAHFLQKKNTFTLVKTTPYIKNTARICSLGLSSLITEFSSAIVIIVFNLLLLSLSGNTAVAAYGIIANLALVVTSVFTGIAQGVQPLISRSRREQDCGAIRHLFRLGLLLSIALGTVIFLAAFFFTSPIISVFNRENSAALAELASEGIRIYFLSAPFSGISILTAAVLSAADRPGFSLILSSVRSYLLLLPAVYLLAHCFGITGVWAAIPVTEGLCTVLAGCFIKKMIR